MYITRNISSNLQPQPDNLIKHAYCTFSQSHFYNSPNYLFTLELFSGIIEQSNIRRSEDL